jgi:hypothetical protein
MCVVIVGVVIFGFGWLFFHIKRFINSEVGGESKKCAQLESEALLVCSDFVPEFLRIKLWENLVFFM